MAVSWDCFYPDVNPEAEKVASIKCLEPLFENVVRSAVSLAAVALFIMFLIGGYKFILSGGDQKKLEQARGTLTHAIGGIFLIVLAYLILRTIGAFTGLETQLTNFKIEIFR